MNYSLNMLKGCSVCNPVPQKPCHRSASSFVLLTSKFHFCLLTLFYQGEHSLILPLWLSSQAPCFGPVKIWHGYFKSDFHQPQNCKSKSVSLLPLVNKAVLKPCSMLLYKNRLQKHHISLKSHIALTSCSQCHSRDSAESPPHPPAHPSQLTQLPSIAVPTSLLPCIYISACHKGCLLPIFPEKSPWRQKERSCLVCSGSVAEQHQRHLLTSQD